jgi:hypothetical protein
VLFFLSPLLPSSRPHRPPWTTTYEML